MKICNFRTINDDITSTAKFAKVDIVTGFFFKKTRPAEIYHSSTNYRWEFLENGMPLPDVVDNLRRAYTAKRALDEFQKREEQLVHDKLTKAFT